MTRLVAEAVERYLATEKPLSEDQLEQISATAPGRKREPKLAA